MRVLVFGDSIVQGMWDLQGGWVQRVRSHYDALRFEHGSDEPEIINLGISGDRVDDVLARLKSEAKQRQWFDEPYMLVLAVGINDSALIHDKAVTELKLFEDYYKDLLQQATKLTPYVCCIGLTPVDEAVSTVNDPSYSYSNERIADYDTAISIIAREADVPVVELREAFIEHQYSQLLRDGLHPNDQGHQLIADLVTPRLDDMLRDILQT